METGKPAAFLLLYSLVLLPSVFSRLQVRLVNNLKDSAQLPIHPAAGPESIAFDVSDGGPYTGVSDGSVLKWDDQSQRWNRFALPPRQEEHICDSPNPPFMEDLCGRPLGLQFETSTGNLFIADAYFGLMKVGPEGGVAEQLVTEAEGQPLIFTNGIDIDQEKGVVYFTDTSTRFRRRDFIVAIWTGDATGRLLSYDVRKKEVKVLMRGLSFANGVALSADGTFVLVAETTNGRILKYWLTGEKSGKTEVFAELFGSPDNIKRTKKGEYWVGLGVPRDFVAQSLARVTCPVAAKLDGKGNVVQVVEDCSSTNAVSEVEERNGTLWLGSVVRPYVEVYSI